MNLLELLNMFNKRQINYLILQKIINLFVFFILFYFKNNVLLI